MKKKSKRFPGILTAAICLIILLCGCAGENALNEEKLSGDRECDGNGSAAFSAEAESSTANIQETDMPPDAEGPGGDKQGSEVLHFIGEVHVEGRTEAFDLSFCERSYHIQYYFILNILGDTIRYDIRDYCMPETIETYTLADIDRDGNEDIIIDLGIYGKIRCAVCYLYDPETEKYIPLEGFDKLENPHLSKKQEHILLEERHLSAPEYVINKYRVEDREMKLTGSLYWYYPREGELPLGTPGGPRYTERELQNGEMVIVKENVPESEIDFSDWQ